MPKSNKEIVHGYHENKENCRVSICRKEWRVWLLLSFIIFLGAGLRLYRIGWSSLWIDEGYSAWAAQHSFYYLWKVLPIFEFNPPFYYIALKCWSSIFGDSEAALRSLSALAGTATIPVLFFMGRVVWNGITGTYVGLFAAGLFALFPMHVQYGQEARTYALLALFFAISLLSALAMIQQHNRLQSLSGWGGDRISSIAAIMGLGAGVALVMWSHNTGALAVLAISTGLIYWWAVRIRYDKGVLVKLLISAFLALIIISPNVADLLSRTKAINHSFWIEKPTLPVISDAIKNLLGTAGEGGVTIMMIVAALAIIGVSAMWKRGQKAEAVLLVMAGILPFMAELLISILAMPVFLEKTLLYINLPIFLLVGFGAYEAFQIYRVSFAVAICFALFVSVASGYETSKKEPWNEIVNYLSVKLSAGQPVVYAMTDVGWALNYYTQKHKSQFVSHGIPYSWPDASDESFAKNGADYQVEISDLVRVDKIVNASARIGFVLRNPEKSDPRSIIANALMGKNYKLIESRRFRNIAVMIFEKR